MKCANEIVTIASKIIIPKELERIAKQKKINEDTIKYCEEVLSNKIEEEAKRGRTSITVNFGIGNGWAGDEFELEYTGDTISPLTEDIFSSYSDGTVNYTKTNKITLSLSMLKKYLESFCYTLNIKYYPCLYKHWGLGWCSGYEITITAQPNC